VNGGVIGVPVDTATHVEIEGVEDWTGSSHGEHGTELDAALSVKEVRTLSGDTDYYVGEAFKQREEEVEDYYEEDGTIWNRTTYRAVTDYSEFIVVPGSDSHRGYVLVSSSSGEFVFSLVGRQNNVTMDRATLRLGDWIEAREDEFDATTGGGSTGSPDASKLTAWGNDVLDDPDVGKLLSGAVRSNVLNQVAGRYVWDGIPLYLTLAKSGYAEVWNPSDMDTSEFLGWISAEVVPVADAPTEDEETEQDTLGDEGAEGSA